MQSITKTGQASAAIAWNRPLRYPTVPYGLLLEGHDAQRRDTRRSPNWADFEPSHLSHHRVRDEMGKRRERNVLCLLLSAGHKLQRCPAQKFFPEVLPWLFHAFYKHDVNISYQSCWIYQHISTWFIHHCHCQLAKALVFTSSSVSFPGFSGSSIAGRFQDLHLIRRELHSLLGLVLYPQRSQRASPVWDVHPCHMSHKSGVKLVVGYGVICMDPSSCHPICRDAVTSLIYHGFASFLARRLAVFFL